MSNGVLPRLHVRTFTPASPRDVRRGLLGWLVLELDGALVLDGVALRRKAGGGAALAYPERTDRHGRRHPTVRPVDDVTRRAIEARVFAALGIPDAEEGGL